MAYLGAMAASFVVAYLPTYLKLADGPWRTEQEGHGPLIMLAAAWLAWQQRGKLASLKFLPAPVSGWVILLPALALMALTRSQDILMIEVATQIPVLLGCLLLIGGWPLGAALRLSARVPDLLRAAAGLAYRCAHGAAEGLGIRYGHELSLRS